MTQVRKWNGSLIVVAQHITPFKSDFIQYREFGQQQYTEIADGKCLKFEGFGMVIGHSVMPGHTAKIEI